MIVEGFVDRSVDIAKRRAERSPQSQAFIEDISKKSEDADRAYRMHLAAIREAGHLTQTEIARRLGKPKGNVSRTERATDMLYSTLLSYLEAAGATDVSLTASVGGRRIAVELGALA